MGKASASPRVNIYLDDADLGRRIKIAAAKRGESVSAYCLRAIRSRLAADEAAPSPDRVVREGRPSPYEAADSLDRLRRTVGRIGIPVAELIAEGRER